MSVDFRISRIREQLICLQGRRGSNDYWMTLKRFIRFVWSVLMVVMHNPAVYYFTQAQYNGRTNVVLAISPECRTNNHCVFVYARRWVIWALVFTKNLSLVFHQFFFLEVCSLRNLMLKQKCSGLAVQIVSRLFIWLVLKKVSKLSILLIIQIVQGYSFS